MGLGFKKLLTAWNRKWLDELNRMLEELFNGVDHPNVNNIEDNTLEGKKIVDNSLNGKKITDDSIDNSKLKSRSITYDKIAEGGVGKSNLAVGSVTDDAINNNTISGLKIVEDTITSSKLKSRSITYDKIAVGGVGKSNLAVGSVTDDSINDNDINGKKIKDSSISKEKLDFSFSNSRKNISIENTNINKEFLDYDSNGSITLKSTITNLPNHRAKIGVLNDGNKIFIIKGVFISLNETDNPRLYFSYTSSDMFYITYSGTTYNRLDTHQLTIGNLINTNILPSVSNVLTNVATEFFKPFSLSISICGSVIGIYANDKLISVANRPQLFCGYFNQSGASFRGDLANNSHVNELYYYSGHSRYAHISIDDVNDCMKDLTNNSYSSIFENSFFAFLKECHDKYGTVFSLYLFDEKDGWTISSNMTYRHKSEFSLNASWLKFGFHAKNVSTNYGTTTKEVLLTDYKKLMSSIINFSSYRNIDTIPRFHYFSAKKESQIYLKENEMPFDGMLAADDVREANAGLTAIERSMVQSADDYYDIKNNLYYLRTEKRLDALNKESAISMLNNMLNDISNNNAYIMFFHEGYEKNQYAKDTVKGICEWFKEKNITFDFPMNKKPTI